MPLPQNVVHVGTEKPHRWPWLKFTLKCLVLAGVYFVAGKLGLRLAFVHASATAVWPPTGIAMAAILILGYRVWPGIFLGAFLVNITTAGSFWTSLGIAIGNTLEPLAGAWMVNRWAGGCDTFDHPLDVIRFGIAALLSAMVAATIGPLSLTLGGFADWARFGSIWFTWWLGDAAGSLVFAPLIILWTKQPRLPRWTLQQASEMCLLSLTLLLIIGFVFYGWQPVADHSHYLSFLCWPVLVWVALRFSPRETATASFVLSWAGLSATLHGMGPFSKDSPNANLLMLQSFVGVCNGMALILAADVSERKEAKEAVERTQEKLESRVIERTASLLKANTTLRSVIAERQKIKQDVRRLASIVEYSQDAIIGLDLEGLIRSWNPSAEKLFGYSANEVMGLPFTLLAPTDPKYRQETMTLIKKLREGQGTVYEAERMRKDGVIIYVSVCVSPIKDVAGNLIGFSKIIRDITQQKQMEGELQRRSEQLKRSNADLNLFASSVAHELHEPVRKIVGFGEMIQLGDDISKTDLDQYVTRMKNAATRMQKLIENLLSMSRVSTQPKPLESVALNEVLQEVAADFIAKIEQEGGRMDIGSLPTVMADGLQMRQLFQNLISNAFKFRKKNEPLRLEISSSAMSNNFVEIVVKDNGIGFEEEYADRIFKPFQRLHRRGEYEGSGLGLAICKRIVSRCGGTITARSEPGKGSSFIVTLPTK